MRWEIIRRPRIFLLLLPLTIYVVVMIRRFEEGETFERRTTSGNLTQIIADTPIVLSQLGLDFALNNDSQSPVDLFPSSRAPTPANATKVLNRHVEKNVTSRSNLSLNLSIPDLESLYAHLGFKLPQMRDRRFRRRSDSYLGPKGTVDRLLNSTARLVAIGGFPMCEWTYVCMDSTLDYRHTARQGKMADIPSEKGALDLGRTMKRARCWPPEVLGVHRLYWVRETQIFTNTKLYNNTVFIPGRTFIMNTYVEGPHFDHVTAKVMQFFQVKDIGFYDQIMMHTQSRYPSSHRPETIPLTQLVKLVGGPGFYGNQTHVIVKQDVQRFQMVCFEKTYEIRNVPERVFATSEQITKWLVLADRFLESNSSHCPNVSAPIVLLQRVEGIGNRRILNFDSIGMSILKELGIICNQSDVIRPAIHQGISLKEQAHVFRNASLIFSSHSAQLRNTIWSHPLSAIMELRPIGRYADSYPWMGDNDPWHRYPTPYCAGGLCVPKYKVSLRHDLSVRDGYHSDFNMNPPLFRQHLTELLNDLRTAMSDRGCPLYDFFNPSRCK